MIIPSKFKLILEEDQALQAELLSIVSTFEPILKDRLFFFEEYTDHGIKHIEKVLKAAEFLIPEESFQWIKPQEVGIIILSTLLHDIGMHTEFATFKALLEGEYDNVKVDIIDEKNWRELWEDYLSEVKHFSSNQKKNIWGNPSLEFKVPDLSHIDNLNGTDKKLIGEFIRRFHARLANEIALKGFIGCKGIVTFGTSSSALPEFYKQLAGITARSHGINVRDTFKYLENIAYDSWKNPNDINVVFLMILLRISDYIQIDNTRTEPNLLKLKTFSSPLSQQEHQAHLDIISLNFKNEDPELIRVLCEPKDAQMYVKLENLFNDIQKELDLSWAILGEIYGFYPEEKPQIKFRRIKSNLEHPMFLNKINYIPEKISLKTDNGLSALLIAPLYGNNPTFGVRELLQNALDACIERQCLEKHNGNNDYKPIIKIAINTDNKSFSIIDNGIGMDKTSIIDYFLTVGASFRDSFQWKKLFGTSTNSVLVSRSGRFGIGILASFLLGEQISVKTTDVKNNITYSFKLNGNHDFIEIKKEKGKGEIGTNISIISSTSKRFHLLKETKYREVEWYNWYISDEVNVRYKLNRRVLRKDILFDKSQAYTFIIDHLCTKIEWIPDLFFFNLTDRYWLQDRPFVAYNNIVLTRESEIIPRHKSNYLGDYFIKKFPDFNIIENSEDKNIIPLKLDRKDFNSKYLPKTLNDSFLEEISKDIIAQLLSIKNAFDFKHIIYRENELHDSWRTGLGIYKKTGFIPLIDYFKDKIKSKNILILFTDLQQWNVDLEKVIREYILDSYNCIVIRDHDIYSFTNSYYMRRNGMNLILPRTVYQTMTEISNREYFEYLSNLEIKSSFNINSSDYILTQTEEPNNDFLVFSKLFIEKWGNIIEGIALVDLDSIPFKISDKILTSFLEHYIGDNSSIPYSLKDRKEKFGNAFEELEDYFNYHKL